MADPAIGIDRGIDAPAYSPVLSGDRGNRSIRSVPADQDSGSPDLASLIRLGVMKVEVGADAEATDCFRRALEIGDRTLGPENPDLMLLLNDLTRLYLKQSAYTEAEPLLLRLLEMKRSKGEDHPEVATVLASLATVRQALGRHEAAEQLWRRVLDIRERTLAPNHFAIATALEHLGDACAARGNITEALPAFQRALTIRERTLGGGHPSLRTSKERIADLQLQAAEDTLDPAPPSTIVPAPEKYRLLSSDTLRVASSPVVEALVPAVRREVPAPAENRPARVVLIPASEDMPPITATVPDTVIEVAPAASAEAVPYREALESIRDEIEQQPYPVRHVYERLGVWVEKATAFLTKRQVVAVLVVVVLALLMVAVVKDGARGQLEQTAAVPRQPTQEPPAPTSLSAVATPTREPVNVVAGPAPSKTSPAKPHVEERSSARRTEEPKPEVRKVAIPSVSKSVFSQLDSVASRTAQASARPDPVFIQPTPVAGGGRKSTFDAGDQTVGPQRARLIGALPTPRVPRQAADVEGEVLVRFSVDAEGKPIMDTFAVEDSPNALLTSAVRNVIPKMRFEPARVAGPDSKATADVVQIGFRFTNKAR